MQFIQTFFSTQISSKDDSTTGDTSAIMCDTNVSICGPSDNVLCVYDNCSALEGYEESGVQPQLKK